jgi:hypothetical protein
MGACVRMLSAICIQHICMAVFPLTQTAKLIGEKRYLCILVPRKLQVECKYRWLIYNTSKHGITRGAIHVNSHVNSAAIGMISADCWHFLHRMDPNGQDMTTWDSRFPFSFPSIL